MAEQILGGPIPDVVTLQRRPKPFEPPRDGGGVAVADSPPRARFVRSAELNRYAGKANRIVIRDRLGQVVAVLEIVSPGNKTADMRCVRSCGRPKNFSVRGSTCSWSTCSRHPRDPQGIHKAIWDEIVDEPFDLPPDKRLTVAAYAAADLPTAYVEPVAVGDVLPEMPIFLEPGIYVPAPLESTYETTWTKCPDAIRELVEGA